jgi:hypothetical protein
MAAINSKRVWIGALAGGVVWTVWSMIINMAILAPRYAAAQQAGQLLSEPRYGYFLPVYILSTFALAYVIALLYAWSRGTSGAGPGTALKIGLMVGFAAGFPGNFATATWSPVERVLPLWWTLEMWVGAIAAALVAGKLYRD